MANRRLRKELLETARGLYELGSIGGKTMREFESLRVEAPKVYSAYEIKRLRLKEKASQAVFAAYLNTSVSTVQKWEIGEKKPSRSGLPRSMRCPRGSKSGSSGGLRSASRHLRL